MSAPVLALRIVPYMRVIKSINTNAGIFICW